MSLFLKQSTAVVISFGSFLDKTDGVTEETGLVSALDHASTGIKLSKNGGALTIRHASVTATTYDAYGMYRVTLDTTDTNTLGTLRMAFNEAATCLPVWQDFMVLPANVFDSLVGGTDALDVSAIQLAGQTITAAAGVTFPTSVASPTNITAAAGIAVTSIGNNVITAASINADAITAAKIADGAIDNATFAADVGSTALATNIIAKAAEKAIGVAGLSLSAIPTIAAVTTVTNLTNAPTAGDLTATMKASVTAAVPTVGAIADAVWDEEYGDHLVASSTGEAITYARYSADIYQGGDFDTLKTLVADAVWDEANADHVTAGTTGKKLSDISTGTPLDAAGVRTAIGLATANLDTQIAALPTAAENADANWDEARAGHVAAGSFGENVKADITKIDGDAVVTGPTAGLLDVRLAEISVGGQIQLQSTQIAAVSGAVGSVTGAVGSVTGLTASDVGAIKAKTDNLPAAPAAVGDIPTAAAIADANWDEALSGHLTAGTTGKALSDAGAAGTPLDAAGVRAAIGMASNNLDTQLSNTYNRIGAPVFGNISGDIAANYAILTNIEDSVGIGVSADVAAIYNRIGAPAGASVSADIAAVKAVDDAVKVKTDYLPSATAGAAGGVFIAGSNAATSITTALTANVIGNVTGNLSGSVGSVTGAVGSVTGAVGSVTGAVGSVAANGITATSIATDAINAAAVKADAVTKIQTGLATPTNITAAAGIALSAGERTTLANAILDVADGATTNYTLREALEVMLAVLAGKLSGAATATITIRDVNDTKNVVVATTTASGDRTAVTITP